jgi:hypothetical protein
MSQETATVVIRVNGRNFCTFTASELHIYEADDVLSLMAIRARGADEIPAWGEGQLVAGAKRIDLPGQL